MSAPAESLAAPSAALLEHRSFVAYWCARTATNGAYQMQAVAVGWQIYELTGSAFDLGLVGLVQFFPVVVLGLLIGHIADRYDRRVVVGTCQVIKAMWPDRKSTRLNSSHPSISYAVFCLKKKKQQINTSYAYIQHR